MAGEKKFKHEWHLYSVAVLMVVSAFFFFTAFDIIWGGVGAGLVTVLLGLLTASGNWKEAITPESHKEIIIFFLFVGFAWALYKLYENKISPYLFQERRVSIWPQQN